MPPSSTPRPYWPDFPVPRNAPSSLPFEGSLDVYEYARRVFPRVLQLTNRPDFSQLSSEEIRDFLDSQIRDIVRLRPLLSFSAADPCLALPGRAVDFFQRVHAAASGRLRLPPLAFWRLCVAALSVRATDSRAC